MGVSAEVAVYTYLMHSDGRAAPDISIGGLGLPSLPRSKRMDRGTNSPASSQCKTQVE